MALANLSDSSISHIFGLLKLHDAAHLLRTSFKYRKIASESDIERRREAFELRISVQRDSDGPWSVAVGVRWTMPSDREMCIFRLRHAWYPMDREYYSADPEKKVNRSTSAVDIDNMVYSMVKNILPKVSKISVLSIMGFKIGQELIDVLKGVDCSLLSALILSEYKLKKTDLPLLLKNYQPKCLLMDGCARHIDINDLHLAQIPVVVALEDGEPDGENPYLRHFQNITDQSLLNWIYKLPRCITFEQFNTNITIKGAVNFIKAIIAKYPLIEEETGFNFGAIKTDNNMEQIIELQTTKGLDFKSLPNSSFMITFRQKVHFTFKFQQTIFRITKEQARMKIREIRREIMEKLDENPEYVVRNDEEIMSRVEVLKTQLYDDWEQFQLALELYKHNRFDLEV